MSRLDTAQTDAAELTRKQKARQTRELIVATVEYLRRIAQSYTLLHTSTATLLAGDTVHYIKNDWHKAGIGPLVETHSD